MDKLTGETSSVLSTPTNPIDEILKTQKAQGELIQQLIEKLNKPKVRRTKQKIKGKGASNKVSGKRGRPAKKLKDMRANDILADEYTPVDGEEIINVDTSPPDTEDELIIDVTSKEGKSFARTESLKLGPRPNLFENFLQTERGIANDKEWKKQEEQKKKGMDAKLYEGVRIASGSRPRTPKYKVQCDDCRRTFIVAGDLLKRTPDGVGFTCNGCIVGKK